MLRIRLLTFFLATAVVAIWLSTGRLASDVGGEIRMHMSLLLILVPIFGSIHHRGTARAFWIGAIVPIGLIWFEGSRHSVPTYFSTVRSIVEPDTAFPWSYWAYDSLLLLFKVLVSLSAGTISLLVYKGAQVRRP